MEIYSSLPTYKFKIVPNEHIYINSFDLKKEVLYAISLIYFFPLKVTRFDLSLNLTSSIQHMTVI